MGYKRMGKSLVLIGLIFVLIGGFFCFFEMRGLKIFPLPGDIIIRGEKGVFFFPLVSCIVISIVLSLLLRLLR